MIIVMLLIFIFGQIPLGYLGFSNEEALALSLAIPLLYVALNQDEDAGGGPYDSF